MISHQYRCIFIHIPKTAGTSIEQKLGHFDQLARGVQDHTPLSELEPVPTPVVLARISTGDMGFVTRELKNRVKGKLRLNSEQYATYFKFAFVRNPWARVHSWYKNIIRDSKKQQKLGIAPSCSYAEFVDHHLDLWHLQPQTFWLTDHAGKIALDFVGKFEHLQEDFDHVCRVIGLEESALPNLLASGSSDYTAAYDARLRAVIAQRYAKEIDLFHYTFGD